MGGWFNGGDAKSNVSIDRIKQANKEETGRGRGDRTEEKRESTGSATSTTSSSGKETGRGTGTGRGKTEKEKPVELAVVEPPETPKQGKPKQTRKRKKKDEPKVEQNSLNMLVGTVSAIISSRPDCEHWLLTESEINSITTPLSKMLEESEAFKNIGEYSNQIALVVACTTVFVPRIMVTAQKVKEKKQREITGNSTETNVRTGEREPKKKPYSKPIIVDGRDKTNTSSDDANIDTSKLFLGSPLA